MFIDPRIVAHEVQLTVPTRVNGLPVPQLHWQLVVGVTTPEIHDGRLAQHVVGQLVVTQPCAIALTALRTASAP